ncbi:hypothetical protein EAO72_06475 [Streptomyces sp. or43]|nr:hypothetical protein EAO72_06475 [Streptomyces sp. or43]
MSVPAAAMDRILTRADPVRRPHIAIGTGSGPTAITRCRAAVSGRSGRAAAGGRRAPVHRPGRG